MAEMPGMPPEAMPQEQGAAPEGGGMENVVELAKQVGQGLVQLSELMASSGGSEDEAAQMSQILSMFTGLVEKKLGGGGEPEGPMPAETGMVSAQGGPNGVPAGPQSRM